MVKCKIEYRGDLHCVAAHGPSGAQLETDAPTDNQGRGASFSPTDLTAVSLSTCMATIMGIFARQKNIDLQGMKIEVTKEMASNPRRISRLPTEIWIPATATRAIDAAELRAAFEQAARTCPVHQSLHPEIERPVTFHWET
jgi:putative redox protein